MSAPSRGVALLGLVGAVLLALGCSSPAPTPRAEGACYLVPDMDVIVGKTVLDRPSGYSLNGVDHCTWVYENSPSRYVGVSLGADAIHGQAIDALGDGQQLTGLGDDARWWAANHLLSVAVGKGAIQVDLELTDTESTLDLAQKIARSAIANVQ